MVNNDNQFIGQDKNQSLNQIIDEKVNYLKQVQDALQTKNDLKLYQLINSTDFNRLVETDKRITDYSKLTFLISDMRDKISHFLSDGLIDYLGKAYPFFYYNEYSLGHFNVYFGNWWDHRLFGKLDVWNVKFIFDDTELNNLSESFKMEGNGQNVHSDKILELSNQIQDLESLKETQSDRDAEKVSLHEQLRANGSKNSMPWESSRVKDEKSKIMNRIDEIEVEDQKANDASKSIEKLKQSILSYTKLDTILGYEKKNIRETFGSFDSFMRVQSNLYRDYLNSLIQDNKAGDNND